MPRRTTCLVCTIKLVQKYSTPEAHTMPCNIEGCPYDDPKIKWGEIETVVKKRDYKT